MTKIVTKFYSSGTLQFLATLHMFVALQLESIKIGSPFHNSKYTLGTERLCANYLGTQLEAVINTLSFHILSLSHVPDHIMRSKTTGLNSRPKIVLYEVQIVSATAKSGQKSVR